MRTWLSNFPIPEYHLAFLAVGLVLNFWSLTSLSFAGGVVSDAAGLACVNLAFAIAIWSTASFGSDTTTESATLHVDGPYRITRNPMYVAWTLLVVGTGLFLGSWWLLGAALLASVVTHWRVVLGEEAVLLGRFGDEYEAYRRTVRRWLWPLR